MTPLSPIIKKDIEVRSRSYAFPAVIIAVNAFLFVLSLMGVFGIVIRMRQSSEAMYGEFLRIYEITAMAEYLLVIFIAPLYTAPSISGEKATGTMDLLLTTHLTPANIVLEKLASAFLSVGVIIMSGFPAVLMPLMFGGISLIDALWLLLTFLPGAVLSISAGMFASSMGHSVTRSIATAYGIIFLLTAGLIIISVFTRVFSADGGNRFAYLLALDPLMPVFSVITGQAGEGEIAKRLFTFLKLSTDDAFTDHFAFICAIMQLAFAFGFVILAILNVNPKRGDKGKIRKRLGL